MTKRINMVSQRHVDLGRGRSSGFWPIFIAGAAAGLGWSGLDTERLQVNGAAMFQQAIDMIGPLLGLS